MLSGGGRERFTSLSSSSSNSTFYVNLVEEVPQDVFPLRVEFFGHCVLEEEEEEEEEEERGSVRQGELTDCADTLSELSCSLSQHLDGYGSGECHFTPVLFLIPSPPSLSLHPLLFTSSTTSPPLRHSIILFHSVLPIISPSPFLPTSFHPRILPLSVPPPPPPSGVCLSVK